MARFGLSFRSSIEDEGETKVRGVAGDDGCTKRGAPSAAEGDIASVLLEGESTIAARAITGDASRTGRERRPDGGLWGG